MAVRTLPVATADSTSFGGILYDTGSGLVLQIARIISDLSQPIFFALEKDDVEYRVPTADGSDVLDVHAAGALLDVSDPGNPRQLNYGTSSGTL